MHTTYTQVQGLHKRLSEITVYDTAKTEIYAKETFAGPFSTLDVAAVCRYGAYISDAVVYYFARFMTRNRKDLFVESPALVHTLVDVTTMQVNVENVAHFMIKTMENGAPTWWERLQKGGFPSTPHLHTRYTLCTPFLHLMYTLPGQQLLMPVSVPYNEHWLLVVIFRKNASVCIKVVDSLHWVNTESGVHENLTAQISTITQLMGFTEQIVNITQEQVVPIEQRKLYCFCAFHVVARVWMAATGQTAKSLEHAHVDTMRRYIQYMTLSKEIMKFPTFCGKPDESEEEEFELE